MKNKIIIAVSLLTFLAGHSMAYSIPTHLMLTKRVLEEYQFCKKILGAKDFPKGADSILSRGNIYEDTAFWIKELNWHFYHPTKDLGHVLWGIGQASLNMRFKLLENRVVNDRGLHDLGGLLHYAQDVTNPAHTAPVFHITADGFDNYKFIQHMPKFITPAECQALNSEQILSKDYFDLLDASAHETIRRIDETFTYTKDGQAHQIRWREAFWNADEHKNNEHQGFGSYGEFGNKFGTSKIGKVTIEPHVYSDFAARQIRSALNNSIIFLLKYQK